MARLPSGISSVIVDPVAINVSSSTVTGATRLEFEPTKALSFTIDLNLFLPS